MAEISESKGGRWGLVAGLILFGLVLFLVQARREPGSARGADAPAAELSGMRALAVLRTLVGDGSPHPVGSPADDRVRERIVAELRRLGYSPEIQEGSGCNRIGLCARLRNVVARLDGTSPGKAVLLMAHYDSVGAGPGVGDDLSGVATILEVARALKSGPPPKNPVILLLDEGEESGLLGARLFANRHPAAREVGVVVNLEARGTSGPSLMFETSGDDAWMVDLYSRAVPHPVTSSIYATIYDLLPNDTDLTIFKAKDVNGLNFAFIGHPNFYHTSRDNVDSLSTASLQHHGDNALAVTRALAQADLASPPKGDAVFFDVLSFGVVRWPKAWTPVLAVLALVLVALAVRRALRRPWPEPLPRRALLFGLLGFWGTVLAALLLSVGLSLLLRGAMPYTWVDQPQSELTAFWMLGLAAALLVAGAVARRTGPVGLWAAVWIGWAVLGLVVALTAPGISYLFVVPALVAGILGLLLIPGGLAASLVPGLTAAVLWLPIMAPLYDGLGTPALVAIGLLAAVLATTLTPLLPASGALGRRWLPLAGLAVALVSVGLAFASAPYSEDTPQPMAFQLAQDADSGQARWLTFGARPIPPAVRQVASFGETRERAYVWGPEAYRAFVAPAPRLDVPGPQVSVLEDSVVQGKRRVRLLLTSNRGAREAALIAPQGAKLESATVDGAPVQVDPQGFQTIGSSTMGPDGVEVVLVLGETRPQDWHLYDLSPGLPPSGEALVRARPASAVPNQDGDTILVERKVRI
ncbi:MAG TPA: M28 family peptidase [Thermoanaerobaculia bacterium]|nr:M28 family peptidase [Thermoanaerobaculia bacterium]